MPPAKKSAPTPALKEVSVTYAVGIKCNMDQQENGKRINSYESADYHFSKTETYDVSLIEDPAVVAAFVDERYEMMAEELDAKAEAMYEQTSYFGTGQEWNQE